jgi:pimeloyl-ACP methyl ester carboxylesterase
VLASNANGDSWGNQASLDTWAAAYAYALARYNLGPAVWYAYSMGAAVALNSIKRGRIPNVAGALLIEPVTNLAWMAANGFGTSIATAYPSGTAGYDPNLYAAGDFRRVPMHWDASPDDATVSKANNTDLLRAKVQNYVPGNGLGVRSGAHGDPSHFAGAALADQLAAAQSWASRLALTAPRRRVA